MVSVRRWSACTARVRSIATSQRVPDVGVQAGQRGVQRGARHPHGRRAAHRRTTRRSPGRPRRRARRRPRRSGAPWAAPPPRRRRRAAAPPAAGQPSAPRPAGRCGPSRGRRPDHCPRAASSEYPAGSSSKPTSDRVTGAAMSRKDHPNNAPGVPMVYPGLVREHPGQVPQPGAQADRALPAAERRPSSTAAASPASRTRPS